MKLTEKELEKMPLGATITSKDDYYIKTSTFDEKGRCNWLMQNKKDSSMWGFCGNWELLNVEGKIGIPTYTEYIPPKPILDEKEKEYLSAVIYPFREKIKSIHKDCYKKEEFIYIYCEKFSDSFGLPYFKKGTMYKGMELDKKYTLEELRTIIVDLIIKLSYTKVGRSLWNTKR